MKITAATETGKLINQVFVNGIVCNNVFLIDTSKSEVHYNIQPLEIDSDTNTLKSAVKVGKITVSFK